MAKRTQTATPAPVLASSASDADLGFERQLFKAADALSSQQIIGLVQPVVLDRKSASLGSEV